MENGQELYNKHLERVKKAIALEKTDRTPINLNADSFCVKAAGGKLADLVTDMEYGNELLFQGMKSFGDIDCTLGYGCFPQTKGAFFLANIKLPGRELSEDAIWQIDEVGLMTEDDYDIIINKGWNNFYLDFCKNRLGDPLKVMGNIIEITPKIAQKYKDAGIVAIIGSAAVGVPYETLTAARSIRNFVRDLRRIPDKVKAAMDVMAEEGDEGLRKAIRADKPLAAFSGGARMAGDFLSQKSFEKFAWPYLKKSIEIAVEEGVNVYLHSDLCWDRFIDYLKDLPKGKCIFHPDSTTDIFKAGEVLKGHMCIMGDISPSLLTLATPDEVYDYSKRLIDEFAPQGFIMAAGCCIPANAKIENVKAMVAAALES
ncbi:uroporphyrinogen decarboxylase family protein [Clostridium thailandense]|uniref:uroporphyrinogen decarboxylase family protein n=1 Tax=Clostridium thailandense TaxID=2794346 RepID=UPI003989C055